MLAAHSLNGQPEVDGPKSEEVCSYLHEVLGKTAFNASERNRRFLSYVVKETLEGRADRIKAYNIALAAFDRREDFDPLTDPIVRIEASRLRRSLEHYYLTAGQADHIQISIPKGSYAATFTYREEASGKLEAKAGHAFGEAPIVQPSYASPARHNWHRLMGAMAALSLIIGSLATCEIIQYANEAALRRAGSDYPSLVIVPFEDISGNPGTSLVARGLTYDVGTALTQLKDVAVFGRNDSDDGAPEPAFRSDFTLMGSVQVDRHSLRVVVFLMDTHTGQFLQSWSFQRELTTKDHINAQAEIAQEILASLKQACAHSAKRFEATVDKSFDCRPIS
jgi:TolB-like protein